MMHQIWHSLCRCAEVADPDKRETAITFEELVIGLRELPYCPPVMFKWQDWTELVVRNELCNSHGLLSRAGFYDMVQLAITRYGKNQLQVAICLASDKGWTNEAISQYLFALKAKAISVMQHAMWQEEEMLDRRDQDQDAREKPMENARFLNMRKLVWEFNRMHRRFTEVECAPLLHVASRVTKARCCQQSGRPPGLTESSTHHSQVEKIAQRLKELQANPPTLLAAPTKAAELKQTTSIMSNSSNSKHGVKSEDGRAGGSELSAAHTQTATMTPASPAGNFRRPLPRSETSKGRFLSPIQGSLNGSSVTTAD